MLSLFEITDFYIFLKIIPEIIHNIDSEINPNVTNCCLWLVLGYYQQTFVIFNLKFLDFDPSRDHRNKVVGYCRLLSLFFRTRSLRPSLFDNVH